ncbi:MAG: transcriptional regulator [Actinomycetota bacterium]|nr:transcriptional regulator [Actinomycetota bacterium]
MLSIVLKGICWPFGRRMLSEGLPAPATPLDAGTVPAGGCDRAVALLTVLDALAPVSRATFLALRDVTNLPDVVLLRALRRLADAGLATVEEGRTGQSTLSFCITDCGREVLGSPYKNDPAPSRARARRGTG